MKKLFKSIIFLLIFMFLWHNVFHVLHQLPTPVMEYYNEKDNSMDIAYLGSSAAYAFFNSVYAYHEYGFTTALLSTGYQQLVSAKYLLDEVRKNQKPRVYIIDLSVAPEINVLNESLNEQIIRYVTDSMPLSINKLKAINAHLKYSSIPKKDYINYYFSFFTYHNAWKTISQESLKNSNIYKGHMFDSSMAKIEPIEKPIWKETRLELSKELNDILNDLIQYIKENKLEVIFVIAPRYFENVYMYKLNTMTDLLEKEGFTVYNFNKMDVIDFDYEHDYYSDRHTNPYGAKKFTDYFANFLKEKYRLPDHRGDEKYISWDYEYNRYKESFTEITGKDFEKIK